MNKNQDIIFETSELPLCAALIYHGHTIDAIDKRDPSRVVFCFPQSQSLVDAIQEYWAGNMSVEPKRFWSIQRELKSRIRDRF